MRNIRMIGYVALFGLLPLCAGASEAMAGTKQDAAWSGTLSAVNADNHTITAKSWWQTRTFNVGNPCAISTPEKATAALKDLRPGEKVRVSYQTQGGVEVANRIGVEPMHLTGTIKAVDQKGRTITMEETFENQTFRVADDCEIALWNQQKGTLADLAPGNRITLTYEVPGNSPKVDQIREHSQTYTGKLETIDPADRTVKAGDLLGHKRFDLADGCRIMLNGKANAQLSDLRNGQKYLFTYEDVDGVNVVHRISPVNEAHMGTASTK